jgi:hypothetical protein
MLEIDSSIYLLIFSNQNYLDRANVDILESRLVDKLFNVLIGLKLRLDQRSQGRIAQWNRSEPFVAPLSWG